MNIYIDPFLLACPEEYSQVSLELYIKTLLEWKFLQDTNWLNIYTTDKCREVLYENNKYPIWDDINTAFRKYGINYLEPKDISNIINSIIKNTHSIESYLSISDILLDEYSIEPVNETSSRSSSFITSLCELVCLSYLKCIVDGEFIEDQVLITKELESDILHYIGNALLIQPEVDNIDVPLTIDYAINAYENSNKFFINLDTNQLLHEGITEKTLLIIIKIFTYQQATIINTAFNIDEYNLITIGPNFIESLVQNNFATSDLRKKILLRAISEIILKINLQSSHHLRTGTGGNNPQLSRGSQYAWRKDIDYEFHLHYWISGDNIELADVVTHNDFSIT